MSGTSIAVIHHAMSLTVLYLKKNSKRKNIFFTATLQKCQKINSSSFGVT